MSWQEDLQNLDSALATGRIAADDYRKRRDELLAQASGQGPASQPIPVQQPEPPASPQPQTPFPPAFKWQAAQPPATGSSSESTTIIQPVAPPPSQQQPPPVQPMAPYQPPESEHTQVVSRPAGGQDADRTQVVGGVDRTQIVPNSYTNTPPPGFQAPPPWEQQQQQYPPAANQPPWGSDELPPGFGTTSGVGGWPRQGPEVFEKSPSKGRGKIIGIAAAVVVVLGAAAAIFFLTRGGSGNQQADNPPPTQVETQQQTTKAPPTPTGPKLPDGPFVSITGAGDAPVIRDSTPIDDAVAAGAPTGPESKILKQAGVGSISAISTTEGEMLRGIWSFTPSAGADPKTILAAINKEYQEAGHRQQTSAKPGVTIWALPADANNKLNSYRAHFITGGKVVRVEVYGPDATASKTAFDDLLDRVTTKFPPTE